jgi:2-keto-4-pentenoate hydratase/2-oxohepta-3-ene-1,7-dioic acid hydratase in catechol pathway
MKYVRFEMQGVISYGILSDDRIQVLNGNLFNQPEVTGQVIGLGDVRLLAPCTPSKAVCIGLNYRDHAMEMKHDLPKEPLIFLKPSSALNNPDGEIRYPDISKNVHHEAELAVVIGKTAKHVKAEKAYDYIFGYTCANDVTARDIQKSDGQWTRGKGFDTFMPLGPWIETELDPHSLDIKGLVNGQVRQSSNTKNLIFRIPELIEFITQVMTLYPGDVILTGTPSGVGPMEVGDMVTVEIAGIGMLTNKVVAD